jgi:hypothetical protein
MPHFESRRTTGTLAAINAEVVHAVNGDESAVIFLNGTGTFNATYSVQGAPDGVNYYDLIAYPYSPAFLGGTQPLAGQPLFTEAVNAAAVQWVACKKFAFASRRSRVDRQRSRSTATRARA